LAFWSGGYVAAKLAIAHSTPITLVAVRFAITLAIFALLAVALRARWPRWPGEAVPIAVTGLLIQGAYFTFSYLAFADGIAAAALALLLALQPVVTACLAGPLLGERVRRSQWAGLALGVVGVVLVLASKLAAGAGTALGIGWGVLALAAMTLGTIYQKRACPPFDLWAGGTIQFAAATALTVPAALLLETPRLEPAGPLLGALAYLVLANSVVATSLLNLMIARGEAARVTSLFFLVPGGAALLAWAVLGETLTPTAALGLGIGAAGVALVMRRA
jgi:drug/metabolite transporter (DMT)-like permease